MVRRARSPGRGLQRVDVDALAGEAGVDVQVTTNPATCAAADIVVLPGSRSTIDDLAWLRSTGIAEVVAERAAQGRTVVGICGGYQMLARTINDPQGQEVIGGAQVPGLGLLPVDVDFAAEKTLTLSHGTWQGIEVGGYEIHHGTTTADTDAEPFLDGVHVGSVWGTMWHGAFEHDDFRRTWLAQAAQVAGAPSSTGAGTAGPDEPSTPDLPPGRLLLHDGQVLVGTATHPVRLQRVQPPGKQAMEAEAWARGARFDDQEALGG